MSINLLDVSVEFKQVSSRSRSFQKSIVDAVVGGRIERNKRGQSTVAALRDVSLTIGEGERVALLGHNGAGKSTFLQVCSGVYRPTRGRAVISGSVATMVDMSLGVNPEATGRQNIFFRGALLGVHRKEIAERFDDIAEFSELGDYLDFPVRTYSSGMQMRLGFAISTAFPRDIVIMDEWLSVGDNVFREKANHRLMEIVTSSKILIIASHNREQVEKICNRGIVLSHGQVAFDGPTDAALSWHFSQ